MSIDGPTSKAGTTTASRSRNDTAKAKKVDQRHAEPSVKAEAFEKCTPVSQPKC
jgi:hypothetical protein